jgi:hypothetical protein
MCIVFDPAGIAGASCAMLGGQIRGSYMRYARNKCCLLWQRLAKKAEMVEVDPLENRCVLIAVT